MKETLIVIGIVLVLVLLIGIAIGVAIAIYFAYPKRYTYNEASNYLKEHGSFGNYDNYVKEDYTITLRDQYVLNARFIKAKEESKKYVLFVHGVTVNQIYAAKYMDFFYNLGYNLISYDQRAHYNNKKCVCTMGIKEGKDLTEVIEDCYKRYGEDIYLGLHGESLGSATVIESFKYHPNIKFVIVDCPYANLSLVAKGVAKKMHMPGFLIPFAGAIGTLLFGYNFSKIKPIYYINHVDVPILFCHGKNDTLIPCEHSIMMYDKYKGPKGIYITEGAEHAQSVVVDRKSYEDKIIEFITKVENKTTGGDLK